MTTNSSTSAAPAVVLDADHAVVKSIVAQVKSDMRGGAKYAKYVETFGVTRETVKDHALAIARLVTPETAQKKDGTRTRFGNAVQAAGNGLRAALGKGEDEPKDAALRVTLSGEGGGSATVDMDSDLGKAILAFLADGK